ncbi:hypothetical protein [Sediminibacillus terrae]|uniref:hypothetical protein n=1 Tax=Sediminibacillus terrae TaxID=1562106 RepID=UPI0003FDCF01|nr:hypothetical protein [Sediminibacillus terrae]
MKKRFVILKHEKFNHNGFIFPYIAFVSVVIITALISAVALVHNQQLETYQYYEQLKLDTLLQMGKEQLRTEQSVLDKDCPRSRTYTYPYGTATIRCEQIEDGILKARFTLETNKGTIVNKLVNFRTDLP